MAEPRSETPPETHRWWESTPAGTPLLLAFVKLDRKGSSQEWQDLPEAEVVQRRARYSAGVEYIAEQYGAAQPLHWQGDGVMLFFKGEGRRSAAEIAFEAAKALRERMIVDLGMQVRIAVYAGSVSWNPDTGKLASPDIDRCGHLEHDAPVNSIAVTEDIYLALPETEQHLMAMLGVTARDDIPAYVFPASMASRRNPEVFKPSEEWKLWERFRNYANGPDIRRLRYVGLSVKKTLPPTLDIKEVFVAPMAQARTQSVSPQIEAAVQLLRGEAHAPRSLGDDAESLKHLVATAQASEPIGKIILDHRSLVVLGDPGAGKTTVLRWLAVLAAGGPLTWAEHIGSSERLLPLIMSVGRLAEVRVGLGTTCSVLDVLARYFHDRNVGVESELRPFIKQRLDSGDALVLLDGLDEVRAEERDDVLRWLEAFCSQFPKNRFVASARIVGYSGLSLPGATEVTLNAFNEEQIRRYTIGFGRAFRQWETGARDDLNADRIAKDLLDALIGNPRLRDLAGNPFLLSSFALIHRSEGRLPRHRVQVYEVFARMLCETWSNARRVVAGAQYTTDIRYEEEAIPILGRLALRMHQEWPTGVAPEEFVVATLAAAIHERDGGDDKDAQRAARLFLERAGQTVQILLERGYRHWGFLHLTFQEFFAAVGLLATERFEEEVLAHYFDPRWEEILRLGVGYIAIVQKRAEATQRLVKKLLAFHDKGERHFLTDVLQKNIYLAALLVGEAGDVLSPALQHDVAEVVVSWVLSVPDSVVAPMLHELSATEFRGRLVDALLRRLDPDDETLRAAGFRALAWLGGDQAEKRVLGGLQDPSKLVRLEIGAVLASIDSKVSRDALAILCHDRSAEVRLRAYLGLLRLDERRAYEVVSSLAQEKSPEDRAAALGFLVVLAVSKKSRGEKLELSEVLSPEVVDEFMGRLRKENELWESGAVSAFLDLAGLRDGGGVGVAMLNWSSEKTSEVSDAVDLMEDDPGAGFAKLVELSRHESAELRADAIELLGEWNTKAAWDVIYRALKDRNVDVRAVALRSVGPFRKQSSMRILVSALRSRLPDMRLAAVEGLGRLETSLALEPLVARFGKTRNLQERQAIIEVLWKMVARGFLNQLRSPKSRAANRARSKKSLKRTRRTRKLGRH